ncbi:MAG: hypothetical protein HYV07_13175 [Deltaproteobacteria bacterium]|nr:hypothetical protein [Deltaproteobacteria bacterium]
MKNKLLRNTLATIGISGAAACGTSDSRSVDGRLDLGALGHSSAEVVATDSTGSTKRALVGTDGGFELELDLGATYAIAFRQPGLEVAFASLVVDGGKKNLVTITPGDAVHLGDVRPLGATYRGLEGSESEAGDDHGEDGPEHEACRTIGDSPSGSTDTAGSEAAAGTETAAETTIGTSASFLVAGEVDLGAETSTPDSPITEGPLADRDGDLRADCHDDDRDGDGLCDDSDRDPDGEDEDESDDEDSESRSGEGDGEGSSSEDDGDSHSGSDSSSEDDGDSHSGSDDGDREDESGADDGAGEPSGESTDESAGSSSDSDARAELPCNISVPEGSTFKLSDAFLTEGPAPAAILEVQMDGDPWRLEELQTDTPFIVTADDCAHRGNRDVGRDRLFVLWQNLDGSVELEHIDVRYCD